jgi:hypothetical protein
MTLSVEELQVLEELVVRAEEAADDIRPGVVE